MTPLEVQQIIGRLLAPNATPDCNGELRTWITEGSIDWRQMVAIASEHLVAPALSLKLQQRGLLALLDLELRNYLSSLAGLNRQRNQQILNQMADLIHVLDDIGVTPLFLKGTAHVLLGLYSNLSQRVIGDIDLLVPKEHLVECVVALRDHGYVDTSRPKPLPPNHHHAHPLIHNLHPAAVELHTHLIAKRWRSALPTAHVVDNATQHEVDGQTVLLPYPEDLIVHNIAHSQLSQ